MTRREVIGDATLFLGDAREIVPALPRPDAVISDPPYGQGLVTKHRRYAVHTESRKATATTGLPPIAGDDAPFDPAWLVALTDNVLLWGAHKFWARLPADRGRWLFWDKRVAKVPERKQGCGEMAWHSRPGVVRVCRLLWDGICVQSGSREDLKDGRVHPTQKPIALLNWCLAQAAVTPGQTVLDPYMGAGSTGVACVRRGVRFIGCEIEERYFDTARRRIEAAVREAGTREPAEAAA